MAAPQSREETVQNFADALEEYGPHAYMLTVAEDHTPHTSYVEVTLEGGSLACDLSTSAIRNIEIHPQVSLLWAPVSDGGYNMIVNGPVTRGPDGDNDARGVIEIEKSVLHRPGPRREDSSPTCTADCVRLAH